MVPNQKMGGTDGIASNFNSKVVGQCRLGSRQVKQYRFSVLMF